MIELILVRHAKSDWGDAGVTDHDRPLNERGRHDAPLMAERLARSGAEVERIVSSTAVRARTTAAAFGAELELEVELDPELYAAPASTLLAKAAGTNAASAMVVAHNPGISDLAARLSGGGVEHMPTCAVVRLVWEAGAWAEVGSRVADSWSVDTPR